VTQSPCTVLTTEKQRGKCLVMKGSGGSYRHEEFILQTTGHEEWPGAVHTNARFGRVQERGKYSLAGCGPPSRDRLKSSSSHHVLNKGTRRLKARVFRVWEYLFPHYAGLDANSM
jgi:hypothetical protein